MRRFFVCAVVPGSLVLRWFKAGLSGTTRIRLKGDKMAKQVLIVRQPRRVATSDQTPINPVTGRPMPI